MAEEFTSSSGRIHVSLYEKHTVVTSIVGAVSGMSNSLIGEFVEIAIDMEPAGAALEISLEEFHELFYKKVFPAIARRVAKSRRK